MSESETVALKEYIEVLFKAHDKEHKLLADAIKKTEDNLHEKLHNMNDMRNDLEKINGEKATKDSIRPFQTFVDRFWGFILGITILNIGISGIVTWMVIKLLGGYSLGR